MVTVEMLQQAPKNTESAANSEFSCRLKSVSDCIDAIESSNSNSGRTLSLAEKSALDRAKQQLDKLESNLRLRDKDGDKQQTVEDEAFSEKFLEIFTSYAFHQDLDSLRQTEGASMSDSDFANLADSIKLLGLGMPPESRAFFNRLLDSQS